MNTCGACKYRGELINGDLDIEDFEKEKDYITKNDRYFACDLIKHRHRRRPYTDLALVIDGSDYYAALCVADEFGCNQWEART